MNLSRNLISSLMFLAVLGTQSACTSSTTEDARAGVAVSNELPGAISVVQNLDQSSNVCGNDGIQVVYGLDHNQDGKLGPYERSGSNVICLPGSDLEGPAVATLPQKRQTPAPLNGG